MNVNVILYYVAAVVQAASVSQSKAVWRWGLLG